MRNGATGTNRIKPKEYIPRGLIHSQLPISKIYTTTNSEFQTCHCGPKLGSTFSGDNAASPRVVSVIPKLIWISNLNGASVAAHNFPDLAKLDKHVRDTGE